MIWKRPEKETDPAKYPGQIVNRPSHFEKPLVKEVEEYQSGLCTGGFSEEGCKCWSSAYCSFKGVDKP